jgi:hypothetical protein
MRDDFEPAIDGNQWITVLLPLIKERDWCIYKSTFCYRNITTQKTVMIY